MLRQGELLIRMGPLLEEVPVLGGVDALRAKESSRGFERQGLLLWLFEGNIDRIPLNGIEI